MIIPLSADKLLDIISGFGCGTEQYMNDLSVFMHISYCDNSRKTLWIMFIEYLLSNVSSMAHVVWNVALSIFAAITLQLAVTGHFPMFHEKNGICDHYLYIIIWLSFNLFDYRNDGSYLNVNVPV